MAKRPSNVRTTRRKPPEYNEHSYICVKCGKTTDNPINKFYKAKTDEIYTYNSRYVPLCKECVQELYKYFKDKYGSEKLACKICCHYLDVPFVNAVLSTAIQKSPDNAFGYYLRILGTNQYDNMTFVNSIIDLSELAMDNKTLRRVEESKWSEEDLQNMEYVKSTYGYDPFESDFYLDDDRKFLFNIAAGFCDDEKVRNDAYTRNKVLTISAFELQLHKINKEIAREQNNASPDQNAMRSYAKTQKEISDNISKQCKDAGLSAQYNQAGAVGANTLTGTMKRMMADDFKAIKVNMFDIKTSEAIKQIADISNRSILEQLTIDSSEYGEMLNEQRTIIQKQEEECLRLDEENRNLKNKIIELQKKQ